MIVVWFKLMMTMVLMVFSVTEGTLFNVLNDMLYRSQPEVESVAHGRVSAGSLGQWKRLPTKGANFESYSQLGSLMGRTYVHSKVHDVMLAAYNSLNSAYPEQRFVFAETGWAAGGSFRPHRTHQNGLSVDFVVPVQKVEDESSGMLYCTMLNLWCYGESFPSDDAKFSINFDMLAAHLVALHKSAQKEGVEIEQVILAPDLHKHVFSTKDGEYIRKNMTFMKRKAWVRHDDHYHVDFKIVD